MARVLLVVGMAVIPTNAAPHTMPPLPSHPAPLQVQALAVVPDGRILSGASDPPCLCLWSAMDPVPNTVQYGITIASFIAMGPAAWLQQQPHDQQGEESGRAASVPNA